MLLKRFLVSVAALALSGAAQAAPLDYQVIPTSLAGLAANITLVKGEKEAVLIDAPFTRADAHRVVAEILDSGKTLTTIIITHDHPDHFFGLDVLADAFPKAKIVADKIVVQDMTRSVPIKFKRWSPLLGTNAPVRQVIPGVADGDKVMIEGHMLQIIGPMQGDHIHSTIVWDPETRTLVAGDMVYNGMFVWLGEHTPDRYAAWIAALDTLQAMNPDRVIAGHTKPGLADDSIGIEWTRRYIQQFAQAAKTTKSSAELAARMKQLYPNALDVVNNFLLGVSSQVASGEIPPWDE